MPRLALFCREDRIRTCDPLVPNQVRYRPALLPERWQMYELSVEKEASGVDLSAGIQP